MTTTPVWNNKRQTGPSDPTHFLVSRRQVKKLGCAFHTHTHTTYPSSKRAASVCTSRSQDWCCRGGAGAWARPGTTWRTTQGLLSIYARGCKCSVMPQRKCCKTALKYYGNKIGVFLLSSLRVWQKAPLEEQSCVHPLQHQQQIPVWTSAEGYFGIKSSELALFGLVLFGLGFKSIWSANSTEKKLNSSKGNY